MPGCMPNASWWRLPLEEYQGRLMRCAPGTHVAAAALLSGLLYCLFRLFA